MADLTPKDRLQPSLLDRLADDDPQSEKESRQERVLSVRQFRNAVLRDLAWLLNTSSGRLPEEDLHDYPFVAQSVLNYGIPDLTGLMTSSVDVGQLERDVLEAIRNFEPRIMRHSTSIQVLTDQNQSGRHSLDFKIDGELWAKPLPESLYLKTELDLETGQCTIEEQTHG